MLLRIGHAGHLHRDRDPRPRQAPPQSGHVDSLRRPSTPTVPGLTPNRESDTKPLYEDASWASKLVKAAVRGDRERHGGIPCLQRRSRRRFDGPHRSYPWADVEPAWGIREPHVGAAGRSAPRARCRAYGAPSTISSQTWANASESVQVILSAEGRSAPLPPAPVPGSKTINPRARY